MKKYVWCFLAAALLPLGSVAARAVSIDVTTEAAGVLSPNRSSATVLTFDGLSVGSLPSYRFNGGVLSGSGAIENTTIIGRSAQPAGDRTNYLTVASTSAAGSVRLAFSAPENYFGLYWGSIDSYNSITFLKDHNQIATFSGDTVAGLTGLAANGDQHSASSNRYVNFDLDGSFDAVVLGTTNFGLEVDNIAFADTPSSSSNPTGPDGNTVVLTSGGAGSEDRIISAGFQSTINSADVLSAGYLTLSGNTSTRSASAGVNVGGRALLAAVPISEPGSLVVLGSGLFSLAVLRRRAPQYDRGMPRTCWPR